MSENAASAARGALEGGTPRIIGRMSRIAKPHPQNPLRIQLSDDRRARLLRSIKTHFAAEFDEPLSDFRAEALLEFFVRELGPPVYNQGVRDAAGYLQSRLTDIEGEVYEREPSEK